MPHNIQGWVWVMNQATPTTVAPTRCTYSLINTKATPVQFIDQELALNWPNKHVHTHPANPEVKGDIFCGHHIWTHDGTLFSAGGTVYHEDNVVPGKLLDGSKLVYRWDPARWDHTDRGWTRQADLAQRRYYPSVTVGEDLPNGQRYVVTGGLEWWSDYNRPVPEMPDTYEVYRHTGTTTTDFDTHSGQQMLRLFGGPKSIAPFPFRAGEFLWYPHMFLARSGHLLMAGMSESGAQGRHTPGSNPNPPFWNHTYGSVSPPTTEWRHYGSSALMPIDLTNTITADRVLRVGGGQNSSTNRFLPQPVCVPKIELSDMTNPGTWSALPQMFAGRMHPNLVTMADGNMLILGGDSDFVGGDPDQPVHVPFSEIYDTVTGGRTITPDMVGRGYHSTAVLLPCGRVLYGGSNVRTHDYQIYNPGYMTEPRPTITQAPQLITYNSTFEIEFNYASEFNYVERVALIRPGSTTHHFDSEQRYVLLASEENGHGRFSVTAPSTTNEAPRGYYMMVTRTNNRVPSEAVWVKLQ